MVVMRVEANLEEEKVRNEEYLTVMRKYEERLEEMEVWVSAVLVSGIFSYGNFTTFVILSPYIQYQSPIFLSQANYVV